MVKSKNNICVPFATFLAIIFLISFGNFANATNAANADQYQFSRTLKLGMSGNDVLFLQKILNKDVITRVAEFGIGSYGQESSYFGSLTQKAVVRFQEKYRNDILTPNGLYSGTGFIGPSTLVVLNKLVQNASSTIKMSSATSTSVLVSSSSKSSFYSTNSVNSAFNNSSTTGKSLTITATSSVLTSNSASNSTGVSPKTAVNPNLTNLDSFINAIDRASKKKGMTSEAIVRIKDQIMKNVATTTDFRKEFEKIVGTDPRISQNSATPESPIVASLRDLFGFIGKAFLPNTARAIADKPFGGALLYSFYCTCSENWLLELEPLPPTYVVLLTYTTGSQAYLSYNIPFTSWLLGEYTNGGQCSVYIGEGCADVPSEGKITSKVGSSVGI